MNERIRQLAEQAGIQLPNDTAYNGHIFTQSIERLAQLLEKDIEARHFSAGYTAGQSDGIIETAKECMDICEQQRLKILKNPNDPSWTEHLAECKSAMEQRFGVNHG